MSTTTLAVSTAQRDRALVIGSTLLTYAVGLWFVLCNPLMAGMINRAPIAFRSETAAQLLLQGIFRLLVGSTAAECLVRITIVAAIVQTLNYIGTRDEDIDVEVCRPYVFWRSVGRFLAAYLPFFLGQSVDRTPFVKLTEYERVTARYFAVKLLFMPMMISFFFNTLQNVLTISSYPMGPSRLSVDYLQHFYLICFDLLMLVDIAWFALGCSMETPLSPIKTVDPYPSGWLAALACYPPLVNIAGQLFVWSPPTFPPGLETTGALGYTTIGLILFTLYVISDLSFGLKTGNLTYRGLVDKGPYRVIRHPMYATKTTAWVIFTMPLLNIHLDHATLAHMSVPILSMNWTLVWPMLTWVGIYAARAFTEERYLLTFPEYREYCQRVRYRFIPGVI